MYACETMEDAEAAPEANSLGVAEDGSYTDVATALSAEENMPSESEATATKPPVSSKRQRGGCRSASNKDGGTSAATSTAAASSSSFSSSVTADTSVVHRAELDHTGPEYAEATGGGATKKRARAAEGKADLGRLTKKKPRAQSKTKKKRYNLACGLRLGEIEDDILSRAIAHSVIYHGTPSQVGEFVPASGDAAIIRPTDRVYQSKNYGREVFLSDPEKKRSKNKMMETNSASNGEEEAVTKKERKPWDERYQELVDYRNANGHVNVHWNTSLGKWVVKQRVEYWKMQKGEKSIMTDERATKLGMVLDITTKPRERKPWNERYQELVDYRNANGHVNVHWNTTLGVWARNQRVEYRKMQKGEKSIMTDERATKLTELGMVWEHGRHK